MHRLLIEKQQLEIKQLELESILKDDWEGIQSTIIDGSFIKDSVKVFFVNKVLKSQHPGSLFLAGSTLVALGVMRTKQPEIFSVTTLVISKIGKGLKSLFKKKERRLEVSDVSN